MIRIVIAGIVGGLAAFGWGWVSQTMLPFHKDSVRPLATSDSEFSVAFPNLPKPGVYQYPLVRRNADDEPATQPESGEFLARIKKGPSVSLLICQPEGRRVGLPNRMHSIGAGFSVVAGLIAAWMLSLAAPRLRGYFDRLTFIFGLGLFATLVTVGPEWLRWGWPLDFAIPNLLDPLIAWLLAGIVIAAVIVPDRPPLAGRGRPITV